MDVDLRQVLVEELERRIFLTQHCSRCFKHIETNIFSCKNGHMFIVCCADCNDKNPLCHVCKNSIIIRNRAAEKIRDKGLCSCKSGKAKPEWLIRRPLFQRCAGCSKHVDTNIFPCMDEHPTTVFCDACSNQNLMCVICGTSRYIRCKAVEKIPDNGLCPCQLGNEGDFSVEPVNTDDNNGAS